MKIAITGTTSGVGEALKDALSADHEIISINRDKIDFSNIKNLEKVNLNGIDVLINNAGHARGGGKNFIGHNIDQWNSIMATNLIAPIYLTQQFLKQNNSGKIIFITSRTVEHNMGGDVVYSSSKSGLSTFIDCLRDELDQNYQLTEIRPGRIKTSFAKNRGIHTDSVIDTFYNNRPHLEVNEIVDVVKVCIMLNGIEKITISKNK